MFENYFVQHALEFTSEEEHKLKYYEYYQEFHDMFEGQLEQFCKQKNISQAEFMTRCRDATTEDAKAKHYINILMSSVEYDTFVKLMKIMRPVAESRLYASSLATSKADAKDTATTPADDVADTKSAAPEATSPSSSAKASAKYDEDEDGAGPGEATGTGTGFAVQDSKSSKGVADDDDDPKGSGGGGDDGKGTSSDEK